MHAQESDEEDTEDTILRRVVILEARLSRRNLLIREELAIAAIARADDLLALLRQQRLQPAEVDDIRPGLCQEEREHSAHPPKQLCHQRPDRGYDECIRSPDVDTKNDDLTDDIRTVKYEKVRGGTAFETPTYNLWGGNCFRDAPQKTKYHKKGGGTAFETPTEGKGWGNCFRDAHQIKEKKKQWYKKIEYEKLDEEIKGGGTAFETPT